MTRISNPEATPAHHALARLLEGNPKGYTRDELASHLKVNDRLARDLVADLRKWAVLPILSPLTTGSVYRIAQPTTEDTELLNREVATQRAYALSSLESAKGTLKAFQDRYQAGGLFLQTVEDAA